MKSEEIRKLTTQATEQLIAALQEGRSETLNHYLAAMARFHRYSLGNIMLIASPEVGTQLAWQAFVLGTNSVAS